MRLFRASSPYLFIPRRHSLHLQDSETSLEVCLRSLSSWESDDSGQEVKCAGYCSSVETGNSLTCIESTKHTSKVSKHSLSCGTVVLDNNSGNFEGVRQQNASQHVQEIHGAVRLAKHCWQVAECHQEVAANHRNQTKGEQLAHSDLADNLWVALGHTVVEDLLVHLESVERVTEEAHHEGTACHLSWASRNDLLDVCSNNCHCETSEHAALDTTLLIECSKFLRQGLSSLLGKGGLEDSVCLDHVKRVCQQWIHLYNWNIILLNYKVLYNFKMRTSSLFIIIIGIIFLTISISANNITT